jgi:hypothetical protein
VAEGRWCSGRVD